MTKVTIGESGWTFDLDAGTIALTPDAATAYPLLPTTRDSVVYSGLGYYWSQQAGRTVGDSFKKDWADAEDGRKAKDAPKSCVPDSTSPEYRQRLDQAREAMFAKFVDGFTVGQRSGGAESPYEEELDKLARPWLQALATQKGWYALSGKRKVARDDDVYKGKYPTFGEALDAFKIATSDSTLFAIKNGEGKLITPIKVKAGVSLKDVLHAEVVRRVEANRVKDEGGGVTTAEGLDENAF